MEMNQLVIRSLEERDLDQVMVIEQASFSVPWTRNDFYESIQKENSLYLVAELGGTIVGYCGLWGVLDEGQINNVAVDRAYRGKHIGAYLLQTLILEGEARGLTAFTLEVRVSNVPAIALYHSQGFVDAGVRKNYYISPREDAIIMWKYLNTVQ